MILKLHRRSSHSYWLTMQDYPAAPSDKVFIITAEPIAIPQILDLLNMKGSIITIDAMGTQTAITHKIVENGGDYILAVKDNQGTLKRYRPPAIVALRYLTVVWLKKDMDG